MTQTTRLKIFRLLVRALLQSTLPRRPLIHSLLSCLPYLYRDPASMATKPIPVNVFGKTVYVWSVTEFPDIVQHNYLNLNAYVGLENIETIVDAGAHVGLLSALFGYVYPDATIYAFEPDPGNFELLQRNMDDRAKVHVFNKALGPVGAQLVPLYRQESQTATILDSFRHKGEDAVVVEAIDASALFALVNRPIDLFKLDIEGAEYEFLKGMNLQACNVGYFYIEFPGVS